MSYIIYTKVLSTQYEPLRLAETTAETPTLLGCAAVLW